MLPPRLMLAAALLLDAPLQAQTRLVLAPTGSEARFQIREKLVANIIDNDVIGRTGAVSGSILIDASGRVIPGDSRITVDLTGLKTDSDRRDGYVQRNTLETVTHPTAVLVVTAIRGAPSPLPSAGTFTFTLVGDLTLKGVTKPTTWTVTAEASRAGYTGVARTAFPFAEFGLTKPSVRVVARVDDPITLALQFNFVRE